MPTGIEPQSTGLARTQLNMALYWFFPSVGVIPSFDVLRRPSVQDRPDLIHLHAAERDAGPQDPGVRVGVGEGAKEGLGAVQFVVVRSVFCTRFQPVEGQGQEIITVPAAGLETASGGAVGVKSFSASA